MSQGNPLLEEAALWFARMRGPEAEAHRSSFEAWLAGDAQHRAAYNRSAEVFSMGKFLAEEPKATDTIAGNRALQEAAAAPRVPIWKPALLVGICVLALLSWAILAGPGGRLFGSADGIATKAGNPLQRSIELATGPVEGRTERLADGSTVKLDPRSMVTVSYDDARRQLRLERGRARFEVAHDPRPFVVLAGNGSVTARGTVFEVTVRDDAKVEVRLLRGSVDVAMPRLAAAPQRVTRLAPGQSLTFEIPAVAINASSAVAPGDDGNVAGKGSDAGSVSRDLREVDGARVADLIAEANALGRVPIKLVAAQYGERRISGRFRVTDPVQLAERLAAIFDLAIDRSDPSVIVLRANEGRRKT